MQKSHSHAESESELIGLALALGARELGPFTRSEQARAAKATPVRDGLLRSSSSAIERGEDPLGDALCALRSAAARRPLGATYTPSAIIAAMTTWGNARRPARVIDPGAGSGRFLVAAGRAWPAATLIAIEIDPVASLLCRAHLVAAGLAGRARVENCDYRSVTLPQMQGQASSLFLGNPPYVRHHAIEAHWKRWLVESARALGFGASQLAGLHVHFFVATARHAKPGDRGAFVTAAEWLDVNYGDLVRRLVLGPLGGKSIDLIDPTALPFADAATTAAITCFELGSRTSSLHLRRVQSLDALAPLGAGRAIRRERFESAQRWTPLLRASRAAPAGYVQLGELCRVHRGQATGANRVWIAGPHGLELPAVLLVPTVTKARELFVAGASLADASKLRQVIDLPADLDALGAEARAAVERFLRRARRLGAHQSFIARHRKAWWSVGLRAPAAVLATYMARRPPVFVRNLCGARHLNIAHGLYPREPMSERVLQALARHLCSSTSLHDGRVYAGGLTKFEPKEMERLLVPGPALLAAGDHDCVRWNRAHGRDRLRSHAGAGSTPAQGLGLSRGAARSIRKPTRSDLA